MKLLKLKLIESEVLVLNHSQLESFTISTQEGAREAIVQHRQQSEHLQESMLSHSEAEIARKRESVS